MSNVELSSTGAAEIGEMLMARSARWKSVQQVTTVDTFLRYKEAF